MFSNFYSVSGLEILENGLSCTISFNPEHEIFQGHFPQQPVVPGVCTMQIVKELLQGQTGKKWLLENAGNVKFLQLIIPSVVPTVTITWKEDGEKLFVTALLKQEAADLFKMTGFYIPAP